MQVLDRLRLRAPPLPAHLEAQWPQLRENISTHLAAKHKAAVGAAFDAAVKGVVHALGVHALPVPGTDPAPKGSSDASAFVTWLTTLISEFPSSALVI